MTFENFIANGQIKLSEWDAQELVCELIWKEIPFVVRYEDDHIIITDTRDDGR